MDNEKIRQFQRQSVALHGILHIAELDREQVHFSSALGATTDGHSLNVTVVDLGFGGVGIESTAFLPRNMRGMLEVMQATGEDGEEAVLLTHEVTAKRCTQISRDPSYQIGLAFGSITSELKHVLDAFVAEQESNRNLNIDLKARDEINRRAGDNKNA